MATYRPVHKEWKTTFNKDTRVYSITDGAIAYEIPEDNLYQGYGDLNKAMEQITGRTKFLGKTASEWTQIEKERNELKKFIEKKMEEVMKEMKKDG